RNNCRSHMLPAFQTMESGIGLQADAADRGIVLFEAARGANERAAGAESGDEMRDTPFGLLPNFRSCSLIVRKPICGVSVLVGVKIFVRFCGVHFARAANGAVRSIVGGSEHDVRAVSGKNTLALVAGVGWHT